MDGRVAFHWPSRRTRWLLYGAVPLALIGALIVFYYSGVPVLRGIVSPDTGSIPLDLRSEFGVLETLENVVLLAIAVVAALGLRRKRFFWERVALLAVFVGAVAMLLEETDYGMQYVHALRGVYPDAPATNLHRFGEAQRFLHDVGRFGALIFFGGFAILFARSRNPVLRYLAPDRMSIVTILVVTALYEIVVLRLAAGRPLDYGSLSGQGEREIEFAELGMYYLVLLYVVDMTYWRTLLEVAPPPQFTPDSAA